MSEGDFSGNVGGNPSTRKSRRSPPQRKARSRPSAPSWKRTSPTCPGRTSSCSWKSWAGKSGLDRLIQKCYELLGLISYLTAGKQGGPCLDHHPGHHISAAGKIHSDFEKGFIRAEIVSFDDLMACGSMAAAKEKGLVRLEGKGVWIQDGDIIPLPIQRVIPALLRKESPP